MDDKIYNGLIFVLKKIIFRSFENVTCFLKELFYLLFEVFNFQIELYGKLMSGKV